MQILMNAWFERFMRKNDITNQESLDAVARIEKGLIDAHLGGHVIKQRIARPNQDRSKGYRTVIIYRQYDKAFFVYGFSRRSRDNITLLEEAEFENIAPYLLSLSGDQLEILVKKGEFKEIINV